MIFVIDKMTEFRVGYQLLQIKKLTTVQYVSEFIGSITVGSDMVFKVKQPKISYQKGEAVSFCKIILESQQLQVCKIKTQVYYQNPTQVA